MASVARFLTLFVVILLLPISPFVDGVLGRPQSAPAQTDSYNVLLHSQSLSEQRVALNQILKDPKQYVQRIQQSLRDYPGLLRTDPVAAKRAVYTSALVRDPSFPPILVKSLGLPDVLDDCIYACPVVFALTIQACFDGWSATGSRSGTDNGPRSASRNPESAAHKPQGGIDYRRDTGTWN